MSRGRWLGDQFILRVPSARAYNRVTHTNRAGTGVKPDLRVPTDEAQAKAQPRLRAALHG